MSEMTEKKAKIDAYVRAAHEKGAFTGTWLYAEGGEVVSRGALGFRDAGDSLPLEENCVFDLASVSKQFTAAAVMLCRRQGLLDLEDEVTRFFPGLPFPGVTVRHLLNHTGGLPDYEDFVGKVAQEEGRIPGNDVILRFLREGGEKAEFSPGEKWEYSNTGYCLLAQLVETVSGVPFEDFLEKNIFAPAGMTSTRVYHRRKDKITVPNLAYGLVLPLGAEKYLLPDEDADSGEAVTCDGVNGDGLVHSNILDLYTWDRALRAGKVLTREEQRMMYTPGRLNNGEVSGDPEDEDGDAYGFGWFVENDPDLGLILCHSGGWPGYATWYQRFIGADRVLILLRCRDARDERAYQTFFAGMKALARGGEPEPVRSIEELAVPDPDKSGWEAFCGKYDYAISSFRLEEIVLRDGALYGKAVYNDRPLTLRLYPLGENSFGVKDLDADITFGDGTLTLYGKTGNKVRGEAAP